MRARSFLLGISILAFGALSANAADAQCATVKDKAKRARCECATENGGSAWPNPSGGVQWGRVPRTMVGAVSACMAQKGYPA